jgi:hypothetical protein
MPGLAEIHVDTALTDFSAALFQDLGGSVASQAFSNRNVAQQTGVYHVYTAADLHRAEAERRAPNTSAHRKDYGLTTQPYQCEVWALAYDVSEQERANADPVLDPEEDAAKVLMEDLMMTEDREFAATAFTTGVWGGTDQTGAVNFTQWDDAASTPIEDLRAQATDMLAATGRAPNKLVLGHNTWASGLVDHPDILDRIKHTQTGIVTESLFAGILGLDRVIRSTSIRNTADEGLAETAAFNLGDSALLLHAPDTAGPRTATAGLRMNWAGLLGAVGGIRVKRFEIPQDDAFPRVESDMAFDHNIVTTALGRFFTDTIA